MLGRVCAPTDEENSTHRTHPRYQHEVQKKGRDRVYFSPTQSTGDSLSPRQGQLLGCLLEKPGEMFPVRELTVHSWVLYGHSFVRSFIQLMLRMEPRDLYNASLVFYHQGASLALTTAFRSRRLKAVFPWRGH